LSLVGDFVGTCVVEDRGKQVILASPEGMLHP
jgi:hypothetical protein